MLNMLKKKIKLKVPLAEISYHDPEIGISFQWKQLRLLIPYHRLPLKASLGPLLEEFKTSLHGKGSISIYLECHRLTFNIEITDVKIGKHVIHRLTDFTSRLEGIVKQIKSLADQDSLNLEKTQIILYQQGFQFDDHKVHRILVKIINRLPPRKVVEKVPFPLSHLNYHSKGIRFYNKDTQFEVEKNKLPVEVGPALERIKSNFTGDITFHIETAYLQKWDTSQAQLQVGQMSRQVKDIEMSPNIPRIFKTLRNQLITESIKALIDNGTISLDRVRTLLEDWGLSLKHQEIAKEIISTTPPWTKETDIKVPLTDITYHDDGIVVPVEGQNMRISAKNLSFSTHQLLENIKQTFEGHINIHVYQPFQFEWQEKTGQLTIEPQKSIKIKIKIDDETLNKLKKIYWLYIEKGVEMGVDGTIPDQYQYPGDESILVVEEADTGKTAKTAEIAEEPGQKEKQVEEKKEPPTAQDFILDLPRPIDKVPPAVLENKNYDPRVIRILEGMADKIYMTTQDLWFRIGDRLIWEQPVDHPASYIFEWPEEDLEFFVGKIWVADLREIRENKEDTGYITRVNHTPDDVSRWEKYLKRATKKKIRS
ncbi:MAG: hypothetical protein JSV88_11240 [Candidatus Aminicenantes bacterium]|nr:MAG: hypothetical protein JSV88_11240 [Candidatus Aminicenantes bacterium]